MNSVRRLRLLFAEDHQGLSENLAEYFQESYQCDFAFDGKIAKSLLNKNTYDVVILDIMLPGANGYEIANYIHQQLPVSIPIIFLTALDSLEDKEKAYLSGGDDYLSKPFAMRELELRILAISKRPLQNTLTLVADSLSYNPTTFIVSYDNHDLNLLGLSASIFEALIRSYPNILSYKKLGQESWPNNDEVEENAIRTQVYSLRKLLRAHFGKGMIKTIHGRGYQLDPLSE